MAERLGRVVLEDWKGQEGGKKAYATAGCRREICRLVSVSEVRGRPLAECGYRTLGIPHVVLPSGGTGGGVTSERTGLTDDLPT